MTYKHESEIWKLVSGNATGVVLDIGCGEQKIRHALSADCTYIGLDHYFTATEWYNTKPSVFATAASLAIASDSVDSVLLLDVLEHLPDPDGCIKEVERVLKPNGVFIVSVPFMYPVHDAPLDFHRWSRYGLEQLLQQNHLQIHSLQSVGHPVETAGLLANIAISSVMLEAVRNRNIVALLMPLMPLIVLWVNLLAWVTASIFPRSELMPESYRLLCRKR